jgi:hypothetical protein
VPQSAQRPPHIAADRVARDRAPHLEQRADAPRGDARVVRGLVVHTTAQPVGGVIEPPGQGGERAPRMHGPAPHRECA